MNALRHARPGFSWGIGAIGAGLLLHSTPTFAQAVTAELPTEPPNPAEAPIGPLPVAVVRIEAPAGGLPRENLEPLLRIVPGGPLDPYLVRQDIALLHRAGEFAAVEARVEPWVFTREDGEVVPALALTYLVEAPPRVAEVALRSKGSVAARRLARQALSVHEHDVFFPDVDLGSATGRVEDALHEAGWTHAKVHGEVRETRAGLDLVVDVEAGPARRYDRFTLLGDALRGEGPCPREARPCGIPPLRVRRWLRRSGVAPGRRVEPEVWDQALVDLRRRLVEEGWLQARISFAAFPPADSSLPEPRTITLEGGPRLRIEVDPQSRRRTRMPSASEFQDVLGFFGGERVDEPTVAEARARLLRWFDERGFAAAEADLRVEPSTIGPRLIVRADPGPRHRLRPWRIAVSGARALDSDFVSAALREASPETLGDGLFSKSGLAEAEEGLREVYRGHGYLSATVSTEVGLDSARLFPWLFRKWRPARAHLLVTIDEGPRTLLARLSVTGADARIQPLLREYRETLVGAPFNPTELDTLLQRLLEQYRSFGHLNAAGEVQTRIDAATQTAFATLELQPGPELRLRSVVIRGNRRTRPRVFSRELTLELGAPITPEALAQTRQALYNLDLFRVVSLELVGEDEHTRDLLVIVDEKANIQVDAGGRVSTDQGVLAQARATHRNLWGLGQKISLLGQAGYGWSGDDWRIDTLVPVYRAAIRYSAPSVPFRGSTLVLEGLLREAVQEPTFRVRRSGGLFGIRHRFTPKVEGFLDYRFQWRVLEDAEPGALVPGDPWLDFLGIGLSGIGEARLPSESRLQAGPSLLIYRDGRDDRFNPTRGSFLQAQVELADGLLSDLVMIRGDFRAEQLIPLGPIVLDLFARYGLGHVPGDRTTLALEDRFYLGGGGSMRGFRLNAVGPANFTARPDLSWPPGIDPVIEGVGVRKEPAEWVSTGGDSLVQATVEMRVPLPVLGLPDLDTTSLVLFTDLGQVWFRDPLAITTSSESGLDRPYRVGLGAGFRMSTPIGPAALVLGINPWRQEEREEPMFLPHLSLGEL